MHEWHWRVDTNIKEFSMRDGFVRGCGSNSTDGMCPHEILGLLPFRATNVHLQPLRRIIQ